MEQGKEYTGKGIRLSDVSVVADPKDDATISRWYEAAGEVEDLEGFSKLVNGLLGGFCHEGGTTPHAYTVIALAALKLADRSEQGGIDQAGWNQVMWHLVQAMTGTKDEPLKLLRFMDLMYPTGFEEYKRIPAGVWDWMQNVAKAWLEDESLANEPEAVRKHWEGISRGEIPFSMIVSSGS